MKKDQRGKVISPKSHSLTTGKSSLQPKSFGSWPSTLSFYFSYFSQRLKESIRQLALSLEGGGCEDSPGSLINFKRSLGGVKPYFLIQNVFSLLIILYKT